MNVSIKNKIAALCLFVLLVPCSFAKAEILEEISAARSWIEAYPDEAWCHIHLGYLLLEAGTPREAMSLFRKATKIEPANYEAWNGLGESQSLLGMKAQAEESYRRAIGLDPEGGEYDALASLYLEAGKQVLALKTADKGLRLHPDNGDLLNTRGNALFALEKYTLALQAFRKAAAVEPKKTDWTNLGFTYLQLGRSQNAERSFRQAVLRDPDDHDAREGLAEVLQKLGNYNEAESILRKGLERTPREIGLYHSLAYTLETAGRLDEAVSVYLTADSQGLANLDLKSLAFDLETLGQNQEAARYFSRHLESSPGDMEAMSGLGHCFAAEGKFQEAFEIFQKAVIAKGNAQAYADLGYGFILLGNRPSGIESLKRALEIAPGNEDILFDLGEALLQEGYLAEATKIVPQLMAIDREKAFELMEHLRELHINPE